MFKEILKLLNVVLSFVGTVLCLLVAGISLYKASGMQDPVIAQLYYIKACAFVLLAGAGRGI